MPERIIDNFLKDGADLTVVEWSKIENSKEVLKELIHHAFDRRINQEYDTSKLLRSGNSPLK